MPVKTPNRSRLPLELECLIAQACRDLDREETFQKADPASHWAPTRWTTLCNLRLASKRWNNIVLPLMYKSYDLVLKDKGTPQENFDALEEQVNVIGKSHAKYIHAVCSVVSISSDHIAVSRTIQLLAKFLHHLYMLQDFWLLFRTADHSRLPEQPRHVKVFCIQPQDMMVFHEALQGNPQLKRLSFICESALDQPPMLIRLPQGIKLFETLPNLETLSLRACIPVQDPTESRDLSKMSSLSRLKIHNAGILRTQQTTPQDRWHFTIMPTLPPRLSRLALVLVDTSILDLLNLVSSTAETLETLSLMGIFITDDDLKASPLDKRGALRTESLKKSLVAPRVRSLSFGRVVSLRGGGGAAASPAAVGALLRFLLNAQSPTITDLCLQASESFTSADLVSLLDSEERPRSLVNLLWWHPDEIQSQQMQQAQQTANGAPPPAANRQPGGPEGNHIVSVPHEEAGHSLAIEDEGVKAACVRYGIRWLKSLTPLLLDSLVHDSI